MLQYNVKLFEGIEKNDLKRLVSSELTLDEYKSKMGNDEDIVVMSFKVLGREPAEDLVNFIEKGYSWVIDADISSGEIDDGYYLVFVESDRTTDIPTNIMTLIKDITNLTAHNLAEWRLRIRSVPDDIELTADNITKNIPLSTEDYLRRYGNKGLDEMRIAAGVPVHTQAPKNDLTQSLRSLAGII